MANGGRVIYLFRGLKGNFRRMKRKQALSISAANALDRKEIDDGHSS